MSFDLKIINGDLSISNSGKIKTVNQNSKLKQDILKLLLTEIGDNKYHPNYGSPIGRASIGSYQDESFLKLNVQSMVEGSINKLISLQRNQSKYQYVSPAETIISISKVEVARDSSDPRMWNIFVSVITQELNEVGQTLTVRML